MSNPRYLTQKGEPTVELLQKLSRAKKTYFENINSFCGKYSLDSDEFKNITGVFVIGSHARDNGWDDDTSDLDLKLINNLALPEYLWKYKKEVLDPALCVGEKRRWIDLFFAREEYQVLPPRWNVTEYWNKDI
jgi:predicted nucleotidyltransferase